MLVNISKDSIRRFVSSMIFNASPIITRKFQLSRISGRFSNIFPFPFFPLHWRRCNSRAAVVANFPCNDHGAKIRSTRHGPSRAPPLPIENQLIKFHSPPPPVHLLPFLFVYSLIVYTWMVKERRKASCFLWTRNLNLTIWKIVASNLILF